MAIDFLSGAIQGGANLIGSVLNYKSQQDTNRLNQQENQKTRDYNLALWNAQNAYNTPAAQMKRYKEAGLNPNLIYGSSGSSGAASAPASASPNHYNAPQLDMPNMMAVVQQLMEINRTRQQTETEKYKQAMIQENLRGVGAKNTYLYSTPVNDNDNDNTDNYFLRSLRNKANLENTLYSLRSSEAQMNSQLKDWNLTYSDNIFARLLVSFANKSNFIKGILEPNIKKYKLPQ